MNAPECTVNTTWPFWTWTILVAAFFYIAGSMHSKLFPPSPPHPDPSPTPAETAPATPSHTSNPAQETIETPPPAPVLPSIETPSPNRCRSTLSSSSPSAIPLGISGATERNFFKSAKTALKNMDGEWEYRNRRMKEIVDLAMEWFDGWSADNEEMRRRATQTPTRRSSVMVEREDEE